MRKMAIKLVLFCLCFWRLDDVFGQEIKFVKPGDSVTLNSGLTEMKDDDEIQWRFGYVNTLIAEINKQADNMTVYEDVLDGRFRNRLKLDNQTGSLTITNIRHEHTGIYKLERKSLGKSFSLVIIDEISVKKGDSVTINSGLTEIMDDKIQWRFRSENTLIAEINKQTNRFTVYDDVLDGRFRNRLKLNKQTGSLTITDITTQHAGLYELHINNKIKDFLLAVYDEISVKEGDSLTLNSGRTELTKFESIGWLYMNEIALIARTKPWDDNIPVYDDVLDGRFRDRLNLNNQTGSLTITNITTQHTGRYVLMIERGPIIRSLKAFRVSVYNE
uniref:Immunoglobulin domain-containing protein n=1 Tax=Cyprinus carpio TaxID=7962 RepID=A0A8C1WSR2_CYPCA